MKVPLTTNQYENKKDVVADEPNMFNFKAVNRYAVGKMIKWFDN